MVGHQAQRMFECSSTGSTKRIELREFQPQKNKTDEIKNIKQINRCNDICNKI